MTNIITDIINNLKIIIDDNTNLSYRHNDNLYISKQIYQLEKNDVKKFECNTFIIYKYKKKFSNFLISKFSIFKTYESSVF